MLTAFVLLLASQFVPKRKELLQILIKDGNGLFKDLLNITEVNYDIWIVLYSFNTLLIECNYRRDELPIIQTLSIGNDLFNFAIYYLTVIRKIDLAFFRADDDRCTVALSYLA